MRDFEIVHAKRLHFLMVSAGLLLVRASAPDLGSDGRFRLAWTFPRTGRYYLFADFTPTDGDNQILRTTLDIGRPVRTLTTPPRLTPDTDRPKTVGDTRIRLTCRPRPMRAGRQTLLTYTLTDLAGPSPDRHAADFRRHGPFDRAAGRRPKPSSTRTPCMASSPAPTARRCWR